MKKILVVILILTNFSAFSQQKLNGKYRFYGKSFTFYENGTFEYSETSCTYSIEGKGRYSITNNNLKLIFVSYRSLKSSIKIENKNCDNFKNYGLVFFLREEYREPMPYTVIALRLKDSQELIWFGQTSWDGTATISRDIVNKYQDSEVMVSANSDGSYEKRFFNFILKPCTKIKIELVDTLGAHEQKIPPGTIWKYKIKMIQDEYSEGIILDQRTGFGTPKHDKETFYKPRE